MVDLELTMITGHSGPNSHRLGDDMRKRLYSCVLSDLLLEDGSLLFIAPNARPSYELRLDDTDPPR